MTTVYAKSQNTAQQPASLTKICTSLVARQWLSDGELDDTVTVIADDLLPGSTANLLAGDVISYRDLFFGMMLPSGNDAAACLARNVGGLIPGGGSPMDRFLAAMNGYCSTLGLPTAVFYDPAGIHADSRLAPSEVAALMAELAADVFLVDVAGTLSHTMTITGANARTYNVSHTIDPDGAVKFPEFVAGKTGTTVYAGPCLAMLWDAGPAGYRITVVMNSAEDIERYTDCRRLMNYELARLG